MKKKLMQKLGIFGLCLLLCLIVLSVPNPVVHAGSVSNNTAQPSDGNSDETSKKVDGNGPGQPSSYSTKLTDCVVLTLWKYDSTQNKWVLKQGYVQSINPNTDMYSNKTYFGAHPGYEPISNDAWTSNFLKNYLTAICNPDTTLIQDVRWDMVPRGYWVQTAPSLAGYNNHVWDCHFDIWPNEKGGMNGKYEDVGIARDDAAWYAQTMTALSSSEGTAITQMMQKYDEDHAGEPGYEIPNFQTGEWTVGVSEAFFTLKNPAGANTHYITGWAFPYTYNSMSVAETTPILFPAGQNACFTYTPAGMPDIPGSPRDDLIHTYDIDTDPEKPDYSEQPDNPEQDGEFVINKVYVDMTGTDSEQFKTDAVCHTIVVDSERGEIPNEWSFMGWKTSGENDSSFNLGSNKQNIPSGFTTGTPPSTTEGTVDMNNQSGKQINLLWVKAYTPAAGSLVITEQSVIHI